MAPPERMRRSDPETDRERVTTVSAATVITVGLMIVVVALAAVYLLLRHVIASRRWAHLFGLEDEPHP